MTEGVPNELIQVIFQNLALFDILRARQVSLQWYGAFQCLPNRNWEKILTEYPGGLRPKTKKGQRTPYFFVALKTLKIFGLFIKEGRFAEALAWAASNGHHTLIGKLFQYPPLSLHDKLIFCF